ncbi:MAG: methyltransferase [Rikenellaceae bacterium]
MFRFKRFAIEDDRSSMKVGTDGVLLGAWVDICGDEGRILDIGTGSGLIALMMAQRSANSKIDAVEIEESSAEQAAENIAASEWSDRVDLIHSDIKCYTPQCKYDLIVTNPPYFVDSLLSPDSGRTTARHTTQLSFSELIDSITRLLKEDGRLALILPVAESQVFDKEAVGRLSLIRRCEVYGREDLPAKRYMSEYLLSSDSRAVSHEKIVIEGEKRGQYTDEYRELTRDFYLKF